MKAFKLPTLLLAILGSLFIMSSCSKFECTPCEDDVDQNKTNIRIKNISNYDFEEISLNPDGNTKSYEDLEEGETSCYQNFDKAYDYAYVKMMIDGEEFILQPIDYVGEEELGEGMFTYSIDVVNFAQRRLSIVASPD